MPCPTSRQRWHYQRSTSTTDVMRFLSLFRPFNCSLQFIPPTRHSNAFLRRDDNAFSSSLVLSLSCATSIFSSSSSGHFHLNDFLFFAFNISRNDLDKSAIRSNLSTSSPLSRWSRSKITLHHRRTRSQAIRKREKQKKQHQNA